MLCASVACFLRSCLLSALHPLPACLLSFNPPDFSNTQQPEMSHNVQKYDRQVYLRVSEAQRCRVHSTLVMPVFDISSGDGSGAIDMAAAEAAATGAAGARPVAVFELVQADRDVVFPEVIAQLRKCLLVSCPDRCGCWWGCGLLLGFRHVFLGQG